MGTVVESLLICFFFFNDTATTEIYTLSLHDALPIYMHSMMDPKGSILTEESKSQNLTCSVTPFMIHPPMTKLYRWRTRSEEHTSELQSRQYLVCRLLLEKKNITPKKLLYLKAPPDYR